MKIESLKIAVKEKLDRAEKEYEQQKVINSQETPCKLKDLEGKITAYKELLDLLNK